MAGSYSVSASARTELRTNHYVDKSPGSPQPPYMNIYIRESPKEGTFKVPVSSEAFAQPLFNDNILDEPTPKTKTSKLVVHPGMPSAPGEDDMMPNNKHETPNTATPNEPVTSNDVSNNMPRNEATPLSANSQQDKKKSPKIMPPSIAAITTEAANEEQRNSAATKNRNNLHQNNVNNNPNDTTDQQQPSETPLLPYAVPPPPPFTSIARTKTDEKDKYDEVLISPLTAPTMAVKMPPIPKDISHIDFTQKPSLEVQKRSIVTVSKKKFSSGHSNTVSEASDGLAGEKRVTTNIAFDDIYERGKQLGYGAFANVFVATHKPTGAQYAVKEVNRSSMVWNDKDHLQHEIDNMFKVREGPNIVQLYEVYQNDDDDEEDEDGEESAAVSSATGSEVDGNGKRVKRKKAKKKSLCHLVVELMEGGELFDRIIEKRTFTEREARDSVRCVLEALKYMHDRRVVHRDLKPENLLLKLKDKSKLTPVKLADFGFAKSIKSKNGCRSLCGTPGYLAPEILERFPSYDVQCDVWSVGAILFLLLGGYLPFDDDNEEKVFERTRNASYDFNPRCWRNISFGAKDLISKCLTIDPRKRYTARDCLNHSWMAKSGVARDALLSTEQLAERNKGKRKMRAAVKTVSLFFGCFLS